MIEYRHLGLYITNTCNQNCVFCFKQHGYPEPMQVSEEDLQVFCDWARKNDIDSIALAGGEPTTHPGFVHVIRTVRSQLRDSKYLLITNLMCDDEEKLKAVEGYGVLANGNFLGGRHHDLFVQNLRRLKDKNELIVSLTLWGLDQPTEPLLDCCRELGIQNVRLDFARASILKENRHLTLDGITPYKEKLLSLARDVTKLGAQINFDCPLPHTLISHDEVEDLRLEPGGLKLTIPGCHSCGHLYVNPDLSISACPHQMLLKRRLDTFDDYHELWTVVVEEKRRKMNILFRKEGDAALGPRLCDAERFISRAGRSRTGTTPAPEAGGLPSSPQPDQCG